MFIGIGTLVNTLAVFVGGGMGIIFKKALKSTIQDTMMKAMGIAVIFIGASGALSRLDEIRNTAEEILAKYGKYLEVEE